MFLTYLDSPVGILRIEADDLSVTAINFCETHDDQPSVSSPLLTQAVSELKDYFAGNLKEFTFPMQQQGTAFQQRVWELLLQIPFGKTISYLQLSKTYGDPKAIRAVASANGKNNIAIVVPCHRVIGSNQSMTGYAGGIWRKRWLLEHEARFASGVQKMF
jgi:methylated-DNA-[protein]-cysteine S-methyltransferase